IKPSQDYDFFFNWLEDEKYVVYKLNWPHLTILNDMIWLDSWGKKPNADEAIKKRFDDWYHEAPKLIPVFGHRYMLSSPHRVNNPILSVWGSDTILYGWNLKEYLLKEFTERLPIELFDRRYEEEGNYWEYQFKDKIQEIFDKKWWDPSLKKYDNIPFWGEIIKYNLGMFPVNTA
ncbi:MAG TPA: hypothetical protein PKC41_12610, partial [Chitinophagaceae bacterium]|nr:hypothetical protein [Chitinophagaceae bacterium]